MIELQKVSKIYHCGDEEIVALDEVSLSIQDGEFIAIMGTSGSGKSTLLHVIGCMDKITAGEITINGKDISKCSSKELSNMRKNTVTFVFQNFALMERYSAYENIELPLLHSGKTARERKKRIVDAAQRLNISQQLNKRPKEMSGGQQQRVALARALVSGADIILADEPTGALDYKTSMELMNILKEYHSNGKTVIIVTHDKDVAQYADRIVNIKDGVLE